MIEKFRVTSRCDVVEDSEGVISVSCASAPPCEFLASIVAFVVCPSDIGILIDQPVESLSIVCEVAKSPSVVDAIITLAC